MTESPEHVVCTTPTRTAVLPSNKRHRYRGNRQAAAERQFLAVQDARIKPSLGSQQKENNAR